MSDNYRIIRRTREAVRELKSQGWTQTKIANHIGISTPMVGDLLELDEVAMNLREPTIVKFRKFLDEQSAAKQHLADQTEEEKDPEPEPEPTVVSKKPPAYDGKIPPMPDEILDQLNELAKKASAKGYRLDCALTLQHPPK